jgi:PAS domain S-box-containing protein
VTAGGNRKGIVATRRKLVTRAYVGFGLVLALLLVLVGFTALAFSRLEAASRQNVQSYRILDETERLHAAIVSIQTGYRGFMLTGDSAFLEPLEAGDPVAAVHLRALDSMTADSPAQRDRLARLGELKIEYVEDFLAPRIALRSTLDGSNVTLDSLERAIEARRGRQYVRNIRRELEEIRRTEEARLHERERTTERLRGVTRLALGLGGLAAIAVSALFATLAARGSSRLVGTNERLKREIAEREQVEERVRSLSRRNELILQSAADGIWGVDTTGTTTFMNAAASRMIGFTADELIGRRTHDLIHHSRPDGTPYPEEECRIRCSIEERETVEVVDEVFWRKDGTSFPVEYSSTPLSEDGAVTGAVVVFRDVTERREVERMKDEFVSVVSHELRTPLTSIRGSLGLLGSGLLGPVPERGQRLLEIATENTDRLVRLVNDILDIERMDAGRMELERVTVDAASLVRQAVQTVEGMAARHSVELVVEPVSAVVWADPDRLVQVLTNLLSNAIKFSESGGVVRVRSADVAGQLRITVSDTGRGIPAELQERIFGRFQQVDASDSRQKGGTGLGLAIARGIVQQHGGTMELESEPGKGSAFSFTVPLVSVAEPAPTNAADAADAARPQPDPEQSDGRPLVLICDDDPGIRSVVGAQLEQQGYRVRTAADGREAIRITQTDQPGAILLDLMMPGMDGWETLTRLKDDPATRDVPVIIFTARSPEALEQGEAAEWVTKSSGDETLFGALERALSGRDRKGRILIVEYNAQLAGLLAGFFARRGIEAVHARSCEEALALSEEHTPDLLILENVLEDGRALDAVDCLRRDPRLRRVPLVVYSAADLMQAHHLRFGDGAHLLSRDRAGVLAMEERLGRVLAQLLGNSNHDTDGEDDTDR